MSSPFILLLALAATNSFASREIFHLDDQVAPGNQDRLKSSQALPTVEKKKKVAKLKIPLLRVLTGNLPSEYLQLTRSNYSIEEPLAVLPKIQAGGKLAGLTSGDILDAVVEQSIKASSTIPTPVRARVIGGQFAGAIFLGSATLDHELKRVLLDFDRLKVPGREFAYITKATGHNVNGQIGLEGDYSSGETKYFVAELLASAAAGYADATVERNQTAFGTYVTEPSVNTAAKAGLTNAASKTADRFNEKAKSAPEFTEIPGNQIIKIIIRDDPTENRT